jgi:hypothetical protein
MLKSGMVLVTALVGLAGCATRPLPEQRAFLDTVGIVKKIRCEAREAVIAEFLLLLSEDGDERTKRIAGALIRTRAQWLEDLRRMTPEERQDVYGKPLQSKDPIHVGLYQELDQKSLNFVKKYDDAAIGFDFIFDISENQTSDLSFSFTKPFFWGGSAGVGLGGKTEFTRANKRTFGFNESFRELVLNVRDGQCVGLKAGFSVAYPITGEINLRESIATFLRLNEHSNLEAKEKAPIFTDQITFNTNLTLSATPALKLAHAGIGWEASGGQAAFKSERKDQHQLNLAFSLDKDPIVATPGRKPMSRANKPSDIAKRNVVEELSKLRDADALSRALKGTFRQ